MSSNIVRLHEDTSGPRKQAGLLAELASEVQRGTMNIEERVQAEAVELVGTLTGLDWMTHETFRDIASTILQESEAALEALAAGASLETFRDRGA